MTAGVGLDNTLQIKKCYCKAVSDGLFLVSTGNRARKDSPKWK